MVLFQDYFGVSEYRWAETFLWIVAIVSIIWGFLLIVSYINTRKRHHLLWGASFSLLWIGFHQVIGIGDFSILLEGFMAAMLAFIPGLLAAGLIMAVYKDKKWGDYYALFVLIMAILIGLFKFDPFYWFTTPETAVVPTIMVMVLHIPSGLAILIIPILTTFMSKETRWPALLMSIGGLLFGLVGLLLALVVMAEDMFIGLIATTTIDYRFLIFGSFSIILLFVALFWTLGTLIPSMWNFEIPGVEFEERA